ncbi:MAG TPA: hypothetical protein VHZ75_06160 [Solirubrobacteraceae bacterium]|jgi:hypothetical protein|nr:hypothetical protein [Solirubrobacteraceae bacterium]
MAHYARPFLILAVASVLLVCGLLFMPHPKPPAVSHTPLAPIEAIQKAHDASALSDAANARLQAAGDQAVSP